MSSTSHQSPTKQIRTMGSIAGSSAMDISPSMHWASSSPLYQFDCFSPEGSNLSFTMTSPPCQIQSYDAEAAQQSDNINSSFSPSIFSPKDKLTSKLPKKRDLYKDMNHYRGGIAESTEKISPDRSESRSSLDLPQVLSLLESPHQSLWASVQSAIRGNGDTFPPTPATISGASCSSAGSSNSIEDRALLWSSQGIAEEAGLYSATSQVMRMGAAPLLLEGEYLLSSGVKKGGKPRKGATTGPATSRGKRGADDFVKQEDSNDSCDVNFANEGGGSVGKAQSRKKKAYTPETDAQILGGLALGTSPLDGNLSSVEKLSVAVKNQKIGVTSVQKGGASVQAATSASGRRLSKTHSMLENFDLSRCFGARQSDDTAGDDSNNSSSREAVPLAASLGAQSGEITVCNCKKSKCLKLYCDCFAVMNYCSGNCNCMDCCNSTEREAERMDAIRSTKERNAFAFQTKINEKEQHSTGCHCKNSQCLKKYCECYTGGAFCGTNCKCASCLNFSGSAELAKARSSARDGDGPGSSRKRKESPSSIAFLDTTPPGILPKGSMVAPSGLQSIEKAINFSPEMRGTATTVLNKAVVGRQTTHSGLVLAGRPGQNVVTPQNSVGVRGVLSAAPSSSVAAQGSMDQQASKRAKHSPEDSVGGHMHATPASSSGRQLRSRKPSAEEEDAPAPAPVRHTNHHYVASAAAVSAANNKKQRQVTFAPTARNPIVYPFFGQGHPATSKLIALKCLDYLEGKDIYAMSQVNSLWCSAAMDDALWE